MCERADWRQVGDTVQETDEPGLPVQRKLVWMCSPYRPIGVVELG